MFGRIFQSHRKQQDAIGARPELYLRKMRREAQVGGTLFGPLPNNTSREFFCLDEHTWVWHEEWVDPDGHHRTKTTRYDVRPYGIMKLQGDSYQMVGRAELLRLYEAAKLYQARVACEVYSTNE